MVNIWHLVCPGTKDNQKWLVEMLQSLGWIIQQVSHTTHSFGIIHCELGKIDKLHGA